MDPSMVLSDPGLAGIRRRRVSLRSAMTGLEHALAMPASARIPLWGDGVLQAAQELRSHLREHITTTEGPDGFHADMLTAAPRLAHAVTVLVRDHFATTHLTDEVIARAEQAQTSEHVEAVRETGTALLAHLSRHRQRGADLIYEAYEYDLGGED